MDTPTQAPREPWVITLAASAGGLDALTTILRALLKDLPAAVVVLQHRKPSSQPNHFRGILERASAMPVVMAEQDELIQPGRVYIVCSDLHLTVSPTRRFSYVVDGRRIQFLLSSANPLFESAAAVFKDHLVGVVLTGGGSDATDGVQAVKAHGGLVIAQDPTTALHGSMPASAVRSGAVDLVLPLETAPALDAIVHGATCAERVTDVTRSPLGGSTECGATRRQQR